MRRLEPGPDADPLRPLTFFFPDKTRRWIADNARAGRIRGAVRVGREWFIRSSDFARFVSPTAKRAPTVEDAIEDLRRRGVAS